jgi:hypothetical protein
MALPGRIPPPGVGRAHPAPRPAPGVISESADDPHGRREHRYSIAFSALLGKLSSLSPFCIWVSRGFDGKDSENALGAGKNIG